MRWQSTCRILSHVASIVTGLELVLRSAIVHPEDIQFKPGRMHKATNTHAILLAPARSAIASNMKRAAFLGIASTSFAWHLTYASPAHNKIEKGRLLFATSLLPMPQVIRRHVQHLTRHEQKAKPQPLKHCCLLQKQGLKS